MSASVAGSGTAVGSEIKDGEFLAVQRLNTTRESGSVTLNATLAPGRHPIVGISTVLVSRDPEFVVPDEERTRDVLEIVEAYRPVSSEVRQDVQTILLKVRAIVLGPGTECHLAISISGWNRCGLEQVNAASSKVKTESTQPGSQSPHMPPAAPDFRLPTRLTGDGAPVWAPNAGPPNYH